MLRDSASSKLPMGWALLASSLATNVVPLPAALGAGEGPGNSAAVDKAFHICSFRESVEMAQLSLSFGAAICAGSKEQLGRIDLSSGWYPPQPPGPAAHPATDSSLRGISFLGFTAVRLVKASIHGIEGHV